MVTRNPRPPLAWWIFTAWGCRSLVVLVVLVVMVVELMKWRQGEIICGFINPQFPPSHPSTPRGSQVPERCWGGGELNEKVKGTSFSLLLRRWAFITTCCFSPVSPGMYREAASQSDWNLKGPPPPLVFSHVARVCSIVIVVPPGCAWWVYFVMCHIRVV